MNNWPAEAVELRPIASLTPYARNARTHSDEQIAQIAASMTEWGWTIPVLTDEAGVVIAGHGRLQAAQRLGWTDAPVMIARGWSDAKKRAYTIADNQLAMNAGWSDELLANELRDLKEWDFDLSLLGFDSLDELIAAEPLGLTPPDAIPEVESVPVTRRGEIWQLGQHRLMCGDSTDANDVAHLMEGERAVLLHADPPYGMGKESIGVANDNLYRERLDIFQMQWWRAFRPHLVDNASVYIWGNAPDLWRLWYVGGLGDSERIEFRNELVWDKKNIAGMASPDLTQYPIATERCLFFQLGMQFLGNINTADFPEAWEPLRRYLASEADAAGIQPADIKRLCNCGMYSHWFSRCQYTLIPERHYVSLAAAYPGHFERAWLDLKAEWDRVRGAGREVINGKLDGLRSYFDNAHDIMRDVWEFPRVTGDEREGHPTPKPVAMIERAVCSSAPEGGTIAEPFGGTGATLIACERADRLCRIMELEPRYCDVMIRRWQDHTGDAATLNGRSFDEVKLERA